jgi:hypothetical protein
MEEQNDSKKRSGNEFSGTLRLVKRPTSGPVPEMVRDSNGHAYIVRPFKEEMIGKKIPDDMVVRAANGRWFTAQEVIDFQMKSTPRCPTYGVCTTCLGSGPVHMLCQKCKRSWEMYWIPKRKEKILDAQWISRYFGTSHLDVRADRTQNWPTQKIWAMSGIQLETYLRLRWPQAKDEPKGSKKWFECLKTFDDGIYSDETGPWDARENKVEILQWDDPNMYYGDDA